MLAASMSRKEVELLSTFKDWKKQQVKEKSLIFKSKISGGQIRDENVMVGSSLRTVQLK